MLSTLERHPEAKDPLLVHETGTLVESAVCQVADDALAFFWISDVAPGLVIWNWRTGQKFVVSVCGLILTWYLIMLLRSTSVL
jgi:hypothetical protein